MGEHVLDGDAVLAVRGELGDVLAHRVVEVSRRRWSSRWMTIAVTALEAE